MNKDTYKVIAVIGVLFLVGMYGYQSGWLFNQAPITPPGPSTTPSATVSVPYYGTVSFLVTSRDADSKAALALTNAVYWIEHKDGSYAGTPAQATATDVDILESDQGQVFLVIRYLTQTVGFVDTELTKAANPSFMKSPAQLKDVDLNGQVDQMYPLDLTMFRKGQALEGGQTKPSVTINLMAWNAMGNGVVITNISSPTGMNTAGDYHATGYIASWTETYALSVQRIFLLANSTAGGFGSKLAAGTSTIKGFTLRGVGYQTGKVYGKQWTSLTYDAAQTLVDVFKAVSPEGMVELNQVNYGMAYVYEKQSGTTWCGYDIWVHTTGDLTASSTYVLTVSIVCTNPAGTQWTETLAVTFTG